MDLTSDHKGFAGIFIRRALRGEKIQLYGSGEQKRDFNHVDDVVEALLLAAVTPGLSGQIFNLGHPRPYSLLEFVDLLRRFATFEVESVPFPPDAAAIDIGDYYGDFGRFRGATGWEPRVDLEAGLQRTLAHYRKLEQSGP
jgi:nucleoside-diphosphate-sugar epimerase